MILLIFFSLLLQTSDTTLIRSQDEAAIITAVAYNPIGKTLAWDFIADNWSKLFKRYVLKPTIACICYSTAVEPSNI